MLYWWGSGQDTAVVGEVGIEKCPVCSGQQPATPRRFDLVVNYTYRHIWSFFSWVSKREYFKVCSHCHNTVGDKIAGPELTAMLIDKKDPISLFRRRGWLVGVLLLGLGFSFAVYAGAENDKELTAHIQAPKVGDIYMAELSKISSGYTYPAYGAMKLVGIDGDTAHFVVAKTAHERKKDARKDVYSDKVKKDSYYANDDTEDLTKEQLSKLRKDGVVYQFVH